MKNKNKLNGKESVIQHDLKTINNLLKQVSEHLLEIRKQIKDDNQIKYRLVWRKYDDVLWKHLKMTDMFCMQVADNKILRKLNEYLKKELRNYVPEHHLFMEDNKSEEPDVSDDEVKEESKQMEFDFENVDNIDDHRKH